MTTRTFHSRRRESQGCGENQDRREPRASHSSSWITIAERERIAYRCFLATKAAELPPAFLRRALCQIVCLTIEGATSLCFRRKDLHDEKNRAGNMSRPGREAKE